MLNLPARQAIVSKNKIPNFIHCTPYMCVILLLGSRVGRSQFRSH